MPLQDFINRWQHSASAERANYQLFLSELCDALEVPRPEPTRAEEHLNEYVFEKAVTFQNLDGTTSPGRIDLYRRAHFVLEAKQGSNPPELPTHPEPAISSLRHRSHAPPDLVAAPQSAAPMDGMKLCSTPITRPSATPKPYPPSKAGHPSSLP